MRMRCGRGIAWLIVLGLLQVGSLAAQPLHYRVLGLGALELAGIDTDEDRLIATRQVDGVTEGVVLTRTTPPVALPLPEGWQDAQPRALRLGQIRGVAQIASGAGHAFAGTESGLTDLGTAGDASLFSAASCVLASGATGGYGVTAFGTPVVPLVWSTPAPPPQILPTLGGSEGGINACAGSAYAGSSATSAGTTHATLWRGAPLTPVDLQTLEGIKSIAHGINGLADPEVVGWVHTPRAQPFRWTEATGMQLLALLPGDLFGFANAVNDAGFRVGTSWPAGEFAPPRVVVWPPDGVPVDLQARLQEPGGWVLTDAVAIGPHGVIAVRATQGGVEQSALLVPVEATPIPTPPTLTIAATPDTLWPPNGKMVPVTITGTITDAGGGVNASTAVYAVTDEYGGVHPRGSVPIGSDGSYAFSIALQASRNGSDRDGREYLITVSAEDNVRNTGTAATSVRVPHDQGG
jgi:hypothetical protein